jgi:hypothetical protein
VKLRNGSVISISQKIASSIASAYASDAPSSGRVYQIYDILLAKHREMTGEEGVEARKIPARGRSSLGRTSFDLAIRA